ncbi:MAG: response regulator [Byssovorax sp.]
MNELISSSDFMCEGRLGNPADERAPADPRREPHTGMIAIAPPQPTPERWWEALTQGLVDLVMVVDRQDRLLYQNRPLPSGPALAPGCTVTDAFAPEQQEIHRAALAEARRTGQAVQYETSAHDDAWHGYRLLPVAGGAGEVMMIVSSLSQRRELEQQLFQAQKMEAIGRLAGGVAHDFNNLLAVILSCTEFIMDEVGEGDALWPDVVDIRQAGQRAASLTRQLLAFSRKQVLRPEQMSLNDLVTDTGKLLRRIIGEDVRIVTDLDPALGDVMADRGQLEQVLLNLAVNARDAMPKGGSVIVRTANLEVDAALGARIGGVTPGPYVELSMSDTGTGMSEATLARVFEPFFTTKEKGKGTGLGLATVFGIVKQSQGGVSVESVLGRGTTFRIYLPRRDGPAGPLSAKKEAARPKPGTETILLVEDDERLRSVIRRMLIKQGYRVLEAADGSAALAACERDKEVIDLIITDLVVPGFDGITVAAELQAIAPRIRVLYMSGYTEHLALERVSLVPGSNFLQKPFSVDDLLSLVRKALDRR